MVWLIFALDDELTPCGHVIKITTKTKALNILKIQVLNDKVAPYAADGKALKLTDLMASVKFIKEGSGCPWCQ